jgi:hypothetical protein
MSKVVYGHFALSKFISVGRSGHPNFWEIPTSLMPFYNSNFLGHIILNFDGFFVGQNDHQKWARET